MLISGVKLECDFCKKSVFAENQVKLVDIGCIVVCIGSADNWKHMCLCPDCTKSVAEAINHANNK
jgi:hypothetical protein